MMTADVTDQIVSSAVAVIADRTAYDVRHSYKLLTEITEVSMGVYLFTVSQLNPAFDSFDACQFLADR